MNELFYEYKIMTYAYIDSIGNDLNNLAWEDWSLAFPIQFTPIGEILVTLKRIRR